MNSVVTILYWLFMIIFWRFMNNIIKFAGFAVYFLFFLCYLGTFLVNPGYPKKSQIKLIDEKKMKFCKICKIWVYRGKGYRHCKECNICIEGFDHHCPWTGKCIGNGNKYWFYFFLFTVFLLMFYFTIALVFSLEHFIKKKME